MALISEEDRQKLKYEYGWLYGAFVQLLADYDPMNLVRTGAPSDEYELEANLILLRLHEASSPSMIEQIAYEAFIRCFGSTFAPEGKQPSERRKARFAAIGTTAWDMWQRWQGEKH